jgi:cytochrome P450
MAMLLVIASISIAFVAWLLISLTRNYTTAYTIGLPILLSPVYPLNPFWALLESRLVPLLTRLPFFLIKWIDYTEFSWAYYDRSQLHEKLGPAYVIVSPGDIRVILADPQAAEDVLLRRKDFIKPPIMYKALELFGPNVNTVNGEMWQRHRRITTPPFNEKNSDLVWRESLAQSSDMLKSWVFAGKGGITKTNGDTLTLALHVLTAAGFGKAYPFDGGLTGSVKSHALSYKDALRIVLRNVFVVIIAGPMMKYLPSRILSKNLIEVKTAIAEFKNYMVEMVEEDRAENVDKDNLMSVLVRAAESESQDGKGRNHFTDEEIYGNLFIYNLAGHDTTANTLAYAITLLSIEPQWQTWVREEIQEVFGAEDEIQDQNYKTAFPKLKRCLAIMVCVSHYSLSTDLYALNVPYRLEQLKLHSLEAKPKRIPFRVTRRYFDL